MRTVDKDLGGSGDDPGGDLLKPLCRPLVQELEHRARGAAHAGEAHRGRGRGWGGSVRGDVPGAPSSPPVSMHPKP